MKGLMKELCMAHCFWYSLWYLFIVEHNLLNALNVEANSDFYLKFYSFGILVYKKRSENQSTKLIRTHLVDFMMWPGSVADFLST